MEFPEANETEQVTLEFLWDLERPACCHLRNFDTFKSIKRGGARQESPSSR
jgi:hypothetical protein